MAHNVCLPSDLTNSPIEERLPSRSRVATHILVAHLHSTVRTSACGSWGCWVQRKCSQLEYRQNADRSQYLAASDWTRWPVFLRPKPQSTQPCARTSQALMATQSRPPRPARI